MVRNELITCNTRNKGLNMHFAGLQIFTLELMLSVFDWQQQTLIDLSSYVNQRSLTDFHSRRFQFLQRKLYQAYICKYSPIFTNIQQLSKYFALYVSIVWYFYIFNVKTNTKWLLISNKIQTRLLFTNYVPSIFYHAYLVIKS